MNQRYFLAAGMVAAALCISSGCVQYPIEKQSVVVSVDKDKNIYVGSKKIISDSLEAVLRKYINEGDSIKPAVVINADSVAQWGEIVRVMKVARKLGATTSATVSGNE